ncbi:MAG: hypothetical protein EA349_15155 [Halomonadaceae bacterium]|nr:MAG: hypothetical protein EA349_15155 [Halomonadaceae bacterium]
MRITLQQLKEQGDKVTRADIISIEGKHYIARLWLNQQLYMLSDNEHQTLLLPSSSAMNELLDHYAVPNRMLMHDSAYNEMIGLEGTSSDPLRMPTKGAN